MKKVILYIFSLVCLSIFVISQSKPFMEWWSDYRIEKLHAPFIRARYGDLYSGCFLPRFMDTSFHKQLKEYNTSRKMVDLYVIHDSYLADQIKKQNFIGVDSLTLSDYRREGVRIKLNKKKKNILLIECSERTVNWRFSSISFVLPKLFIKNKLNKISVKEETKVQRPLEFLFNPKINQNIEFNLFDYELFKPLKEVKAEINYTYFNKLPMDIAVSSDKKYLLLSETVNNEFSESSFRWLPDEQIDLIVNNMNEITRHYTKIGFDRVYFSIIPNPVTIIDPDRMMYNNKINRILDNYWLQPGTINIYDTFKKCKKQIYRRDDSHWNSNGLQLWVDEVNKKLLAY